MILGFWSQEATAQSLQSNWILPDGQQPDFSQTFKNGAPIAVAWEAWSPSQRTAAYGSELTTASLWVTSYNFADVTYSQKLTGMQAVIFSTLF